MDIRNCKVVGCLAVFLVTSMMLYSFIQFNSQNPDMAKLSKLMTLLHNQTTKLKTPNGVKTQLAPLYNSDADIIHIPLDEELKKMELLDLEQLYMRYLENIQQACGTTQHMGAEFDGGYHVCEKYMVKDKCLVYSFGSRNLYDFEDDVTKAYGCEIHTFDPFDGQNDHQHSPKNAFHKLGLGGKDEGPLLTLTSIKKKLNQSDTILDILKIDIEGAEWAALPEMVSSGELSRVKLLIIEFHICLDICKDLKFRNKEQYLTRLAALRNIYNLGFRLYYFRQWTMCHLVDELKRVKTGCHEVHFMKVY